MRPGGNRPLPVRSIAITMVTTEQRGGGNGQVQSLTRALGLLNILAGEDRGLGLSEIAFRADLPVSTVHRLLTTLQVAGYVRFSADGGQWQVGVQAFVVGVSFLRSRDLTAIARPIMRRMMEKSGETANLGIADQGEIVYMDQVECQQMMRAMAKPGSRVGMYCSALGKALLAYLPMAEVRRLMDWRGLPRLTPNTITIPERLLEQLAAIRDHGFAVDDEEHSVGLRCVAAPIFDEAGQPVAAVSLAAPTPRTTPESFAILGGIVREGARDITAAMGGRAMPCQGVTS